MSRRCHLLAAKDFWVGITAAIATGVILALLSGFFIGRGTRLLN